MNENKIIEIVLAIIYPILFSLYSYKVESYLVNNRVIVLITTNKPKNKNIQFAIDKIDE